MLRIKKRRILQWTSTNGASKPQREELRPLGRPTTSLLIGETNPRIPGTQRGRLASKYRPSATSPWPTRLSISIPETTSRQRGKRPAFQAHSGITYPGTNWRTICCTGSDAVTRVKYLEATHIPTDGAWLILMSNRAQGIFIIKLKARR